MPPHCQHLLFLCITLGVSLCLCVCVCPQRVTRQATYFGLYEGIGHEEIKTLSSKYPNTNVLALAPDFIASDFGNCRHFGGQSSRPSLLPVHPSAHMWKFDGVQMSSILPNGLPSGNLT